MSLVTLVSPYTDAIVVTPTAGNGITLHEDGDFALSSDREWYYSTDDVAYGAMVRVAQGEVVSIRRSGSDKSLYLRTRSGAAQLAVAFSALPVPASGGGAAGLGGIKLLVVGKGGSDAAGAASKYTAEFLTIAAALTAAVAGDSLVIKPGTYAESLTLKNGVNIFGFPGVTMSPDAGGGTLFTDGGSGVVCAIDGGIDFESAVGGDSFASFTGSGVIIIRGRKWVFNNAAATGITKGGSCVVVLDILGEITGRQNVVSASGTGSISVRGDTVRSVTGPVVEIAGGSPPVSIEAAQSISGYTIIASTGNGGATRVSMKAPSITSTEVQNTIDLGGTNSGRYDFECDTLKALVRNQAPNAELHIRAKHHVCAFNSGNALELHAGSKTFVDYEECVGADAASVPCPIVLIDADTELHILRGRIIGLDAVGGACVQIGHDDAKLVLYPGAVLIAGASAAKALALAGGAATPTVVAMGDIAANKGAAAGITVAVGSLLVDAAVA